MQSPTKKQARRLERLNSDRHRYNTRLEDSCPDGENLFDIAGGMLSTCAQFLWCYRGDIIMPLAETLQSDSRPVFL